MPYKNKIKWKYKIGQVVKDEKRYLTIIDRKIDNNYKYYKYKCNKCGFNGGKHWSIKDKCYKNEFWIVEHSLLHNTGCSCCGINSKIVVKGINDVATIYPNVIEYILNINDAYTHTSSSHYKILCKCKNCNYNKKVTVSNLVRHGFSCPQCSDGIQYPEKFMFNLLKQLKQNNKLNDFIYQYSKTNDSWCKKYRYDFYFELNGERYIIETHGQQHYKNNTRFKMSLEDQQNNDKNKKELAIKNGIKEENYMIIDCRKSEFEFIKQNIINSKLNEIFNLNIIDWIKIGQYSEKSLVKEICDYWHLHNDINNEELTTSNLIKLFNIDRTSIIKYLKIGVRLGWCNYDPKEEITKGRIKTSLGKKVEIFKDEISLGIFKSCAELERKSERLFGIHLNSKNISAVINGSQLTHKGFTFKYV